MTLVRARQLPWITGGVGKTRLALRTAARSHGLFNGGARVVELSPARQTDLLATVLAEALGLGRSSRPPLDLVIEELRGKSTLLVLDNCEHLAAEVGALVEQLLCAMPTLHVLATSRQPLAVPSEHLFTVAPLRLPDESVSVEGALAYSAMALFADRAGAAVPGFSVTDDNVGDVAALCRRLEGIPLAIELAAVRLKVLSPRELGERLHDRFQLLADVRPGRPVRHQTLRTTLEWTCELCSPLEQRLWAYASLFGGGFTVDALEWVCGEAGAASPDEVLSGLSGLVDKSVLARTERDGRVRFRMLETIREYGVTLLESRTEHNRIRDCYLRWCRRLVDEFGSSWFSREREAFAVLGTEHNNLRAAISISLDEPGKRLVGLHIAASLWFYWIPRAPAEGRQWLERLLSASSSDPPSPERTHALISHAYLLVMQGDRELVRTRLSAAVRAGDSLSAGYAAHVLGMAAFFDGDLEAAADLMDEAADRYREHGASRGWQISLDMHLGLLRLFQGRTDLAEGLFSSAAAICERDGEQYLHSYLLYGLSLIDHRAGRHLAALDRLVRSARMKHPFDDVVGTALVLELVARIRADQGDGDRAAVALGAAGRQWRAFGTELYGSRAWLEQRRHCEELIVSLLGPAAFTEARERGAAWNRQDALAFVLNLTRPARTRRSPDDPGLTRRETQTAALVAQGLTNRTIARRLNLSVRTVEGHVQQLLNKLGFTSRTQIAAWFSTRTAHTSSADHATR